MISLVSQTAKKLKPAHSWIRVVTPCTWWNLQTMSVSSTDCLQIHVYFQLLWKVPITYILILKLFMRRKYFEKTLNTCLGIVKDSTGNGEIFLLLSSYCDTKQYRAPNREKKTENRKLIEFWHWKYICFAFKYKKGR